MVFDKVKELIVDQLDVEEDAVKTESVIIDDLGADSLDVVDLVMSIEEEFDIEIPTVEIVPANFNSAQSMWEMIHRLEEE